MIRQLNPTELDIIEFLVDEFLLLHYKDAAKRSQMKKSLPHAIESQQFTLLAGISEDRPFCFGTISNSTGTINMLYSTEGMWERCLSEMIDYLKTRQSVIRVLGKYLPESVYESIVNTGFRRYDRAYMTIPYDTIRLLNQTALPKGYSIIPYDPTAKEKLATVLLDSYRGTSVPIIFPDFYSTLEGCYKSLENWIQSGRIYILIADWNPIGLCAINSKDNYLFVTNLSLLSAYHGKGLGKTLLVLSLLKASNDSNQIQSASLEVNISDKAYDFYKKLGFATDYYVSYFVWVKE